MKKKILVTGSNSAQCIYDHYLNMQLNVVTTQYGLTRALADMGWEVTQRPVVIGESLEEFDKVIVFIHNPAGFAGYVYNALWAIYVRPDCILSIDDWQSDSIFIGISSLTPDTIFRPYVKDNHVNLIDGVELYLTQFMESIERIKRMENQMLIAGYLGGDIGLMLPDYPKHLLNTYHIQPYSLNRRPENNFTGNDSEFFFEDMCISPTTKKLAWTFVSLMHGKTRKFLKTLDMSGSWPIDYYGSARGEFKSPRLKEPDMCNEYQKHWGCIVPKYYHAGSGFWRPRVFQVADAGSILVVHDDEGKVYGEPYVGCKPRDIEGMDISQLVALAKCQKEALYDTQPLDKSITKRQLEEVLAK